MRIKNTQTYPSLKKETDVLKRDASGEIGTAEAGEEGGGRRRKAEEAKEAARPYCSRKITEPRKKCLAHVHQPDSDSDFASDSDSGKVKGLSFFSAVLCLTCESHAEPQYLEADVNLQNEGRRRVQN